MLAPCQPATLPQLLKARKSIVMFDRDYSPSPFPTVTSDNFQGGLALTRRMLQESQGSFFFLCGHAELPSIHDRIRGFSAACDEFGIDDSARLLRLETENKSSGRTQAHARADRHAARTAAPSCARHC